MSPTDTSSMIQIEKPAPPAIVAQLAPLVSGARAFAVIDVDTNRVALERVRSLRSAEKAITDHFEPARKAADEAKKAILQARDSLVGPIAEARSIYDRSAATYEEGERRKAEQEQRRLQEQARKQEEERALLEAIDAEASGDAQGAAEILAAPVTVAVVAVAPAVAKVEGVSSRTTWSAEVYELLSLVQHVAAHPEWISLLEPCLPNLNRLAVAQREALRIPGVRAVSKSVRSTR